MRSKQIWQWVYLQGVKSFEEMKNLPAKLKHQLKDHFDFARPEIIEALISTDGTRKWLMKFPDGNEVETVFIPEKTRGTLCVSSQVGCTLTCKFCHTGTQRLVRNLTAEEIIMQFMVARDYIGEWDMEEEGRLVSTIVLMGMGEPLYNFDNVVKAMKVLMDDNGVNLGRRRITLSTSGVVPEIYRCGEELGVNLAISLHAVNDKTRSEIMPINKKYPMADLLKACKDYAGLRNSRKITFEYVMIKDVNDSAEDARELVRLLKTYQIPAKVNLIPFNPWPGSSYERSSSRRVKKFSEIIFDSGISAPIRTTRGEDILAACGQLKSESEKRRKSDILREKKAAASAF
jgi:23S rRNA (adenine2503-C2)-methyltransferase